MNQITIITTITSVNSAFANRLKCIAKGFQENNIKVNILGIYASKNICENFNNEGFVFVRLSKSNNKHIMLITGVLNLLFHIHRYRNLFVFTTYTLVINLIHIFKKRDSFTMHERTEHPELSKNKLEIVAYIKACNKFDHITVISTSLKDYFMSKGISPNKISILPMLVNPDRFIAMEDETKKFHFPYFAYCGDMGGNKDGLHNLIDSFSIFAKQNTTHNLILIGDTKRKDQYAELQNKVKNLQLSNRIVFIGRVDAGDVPNLLNNADVLLLARPDNIQAKYGFPTKLGEYLATGKPVIVTDTSDIKKLLQNDVYIVEPNNIEQFAEIMLYVIGNKEEAEEIGLRGKNHIYSTFNYRVQLKKLLQVEFSNI